MTAPFEYPVAPHARRHGPRGYADYESYRPWLRDEFAFRCVYCLTREAWGPLVGAFALDHFLPVASRPDLAVEYDNLLYGCACCNLSKGSQQSPDPLQVLLAANVVVAPTGEVRASTAAARKLVELLGLNRPRLREFRELWIGIVRLAALHDQDVLRRLTGYPTDLPDLSTLRPPAGNSRPAGVAQSHLTRRERGDLPECY